MEEINKNKKYKLADMAEWLSLKSGTEITYNRLFYYVKNAQLKTSKLLGKLMVKGDEMERFYNEKFTDNN